MVEEIKEFSKIKNINSKFVKENCYNILMKIIPGLIENDFEPFAEGIQKIQENMSKIFYGKKYYYFSENISRIFNFYGKKIIWVLASHPGGHQVLFFVKIKQKEMNY